MSKSEKKKSFSELFKIAITRESDPEKEELLNIIFIVR